MAARSVPTPIGDSKHAHSLRLHEKRTWCAQVNGEDGRVPEADGVP